MHRSFVRVHMFRHWQNATTCTMYMNKAIINVFSLGALVLGIGPRTRTPAAAKWSGRQAGGTAEGVIGTQKQHARQNRIEKNETCGQSHTGPHARARAGGTKRDRRRRGGKRVRERSDNAHPTPSIHIHKHKQCVVYVLYRNYPAISRPPPRHRPNDAGGNRPRSSGETLLNKRSQFL